MRLSHLTFSGGPSCGLASRPVDFPDSLERLGSCVIHGAQPKELAQIIGDVFACDVFLEDSKSHMLASTLTDVKLDPVAKWLSKPSRLPFLDMLEYWHQPIFVEARFSKRGKSHFIIPVIVGKEFLGYLCLLDFGRKQIESSRPSLVCAITTCALMFRNIESSRGHVVGNLLDSIENQHLIISRELHDETSQNLVALKVWLATARSAYSMGDGSRAQQIIEDSACLADHILDDVNTLAAGLRPSELNYLGFMQAVDAVAHSKLDRVGIAYDFSGNALNARFGNLQERVLLQGVKEALTNISRHSGARKAHILIAIASSSLEVTISDDGHGFDSDKYVDDGRFAHECGMKSMHDCAELLYGEFWIGSWPGKGTIVRFRIPMSALEEHER